MITTFTAKLSVNEIEQMIKREVESAQPDFKVKSVTIDVTGYSGYRNEDYTYKVSGTTVVLERK